MFKNWPFPFIFKTTGSKIKKKNKYGISGLLIVCRKPLAKMIILKVITKIRIKDLFKKDIKIGSFNFGEFRFLLELEHYGFFPALKYCKICLYSYYSFLEW